MRVPDRILAVLATALGALAIALGVLAVAQACDSATPDGVESGEGEGRQGRRTGNWKRARGAGPEDEDLGGLGYVDGVTPAGSEIGVTIHDRERAEAGLNLVVSGHRPEVNLMDMEGTLRHSWSIPFDRVWPGRTDMLSRYHTEFFRRARVLPNGDLLAIFEGLGIVRLDTSNELVWAYDGGAHHDLRVLPDGRLFTLRRAARIVPSIDPDHEVFEDFVCELDPDDGSELAAWSLFEAAFDSEYEDMFRRGIARYLRIADRQDPGTRDLWLWGDVFHTNSLHVFSDEGGSLGPVFAPGNVLVSIRSLNLLAVLDTEARKIVHVLKGPWEAQHEAMLLSGGTILLFDNKGEARRSAVLEIDAQTGELVWSYRAEEPDAFYSARSGICQRLPGGNTLVIESNAGRAFELAPDETIVWEFHSPFRAGEDDELVANLFDVERLPADFPTSWLE